MLRHDQTLFNRNAISKGTMSSLNRKKVLLVLQYKMKMGDKILYISIFSSIFKSVGRKKYYIITIHTRVIVQHYINYLILQDLFKFGACNISIFFT